MSKLNPNAGEWIPPTFATSVAITSPRHSLPVAVAPVYSNVDTKKMESETSVLVKKPLFERPMESNDEVMQSENHGISSCCEGYSPIQDRFIYSKSYLLAFQPLGDYVIQGIPDVVRNPRPLKKIGDQVKGRFVYTIAELLQFQPLFQMMPENFTWADTIGADVIMAENKSKKYKKDKNRQLHGNIMSYDASLVRYFNPSEYSAAMNMGLYTGPPTEASTEGFDGKSNLSIVEPVNPVEEAIIARRRIATLLDDVKPNTIDSILESFMSIRVSCIHTLQEIIGQVFDHAIANPELSDSYAKLCMEMSKRTPEFKDGAKTINFRRILLTKCYESLIEEPGSQPLHLINKKMETNATTQHSWRRKCMLQNVRYIGELFRRQLLTENIMHVCVAMMLDDEIHPQSEIIEAACRLLNLVGDLLDGSSPASRRTMDEYFEVLMRIQENYQLSDHVKKLITELKTVRVNGWLKTRQENSSAPSTPASSAKLAGCESNGRANSLNSPITEDRSLAGTSAREVTKTTE
ncbi:unnamed protein product [Peronospora belbahrii]|uniref:MIF4G domain-containing protein n=1 Tax=Peronospora belbahrii TaxID=622444 RepID=A0AAU9KJA3_9STRA|nr:unnamed protein product [Peronospora belbahrii]